MAAPVPSSSQASAGRRGISPPPRQLRAVSSDRLPSTPTPPSPEQQAAKMRDLLRTSPASQPSPTGLPTTTSSQPTRRPPARIKPQANTLGNLLARQQYDAGPANDNDLNEGSSMEPDYLSMDEPEFPEQQPSVLDAARPFPTSDQPPANDNATSSAEQQKNRDQAFQQQQATARANQEQFIKPNSPSASQPDPISSSPQQTDASSLQQQQIDRLRAMNQQHFAAMNSEGSEPTTQDALSHQHIEETVSAMAELGQSGRRSLTFLTGIFTLTFVPSIEALIEQHLVVINHKVFNGQIPGLGKRSPGAAERNPTIAKIDLIDLFIAFCMDGTAVGALLIILGMLGVIVYVGYLFTTNSADLIQQLIN